MELASLICDNTILYISKPRGTPRRFTKTVNDNIFNVLLYPDKTFILSAKSDPSNAKKYLNFAQIRVIFEKY